MNPILADGNYLALYALFDRTVTVAYDTPSFNPELNFPLICKTGHNLWTYVDSFLSLFHLYGQFVDVTLISRLETVTYTRLRFDFCKFLVHIAYKTIILFFLQKSKMR